MNLPFGQYVTVLRRHLGSQWPRMALLGVLLLLSTALSVANPQLLRVFIDAALAGAQGAQTPAIPGVAVLPIPGAATETTLLWTALAFLGVGVTNQLLAALATYVSNDVGWTATNRLRADLALHCLRLDTTFHNARTPGEMIERIDGDVNALANFFSAFTVRVLGSVLLLIGVTIMLWREDWRVGLLMGTFSVVTFFVLHRSREMGVPAAKAEREASAKLFGFLEERLTGIDDIRANGAGEYVMRRYYETNRVLFSAGRRSWRMRSIMWVTTMGMFALANAVALGLGYQLFSLTEISLGTVYLIAHYTEILSGPLERITQELQDLQRAGASLDRIQELYSEKSTLPEARGKALPAGPLAVEFDGVTFVYPDAGGSWTGPPPSLPPLGGGARVAALDTLPQRETTDLLRSKREGVRGRGGAGVGEGAGNGAHTPLHGDTADQREEAVLRNVSFRLEPGRVLGLLGRTGSGKTTATRLLFRLFDATQGAVRVGGVDVREPDLSTLRERVAVVTQDVQLFSGAVRDNLTLFDPTITDARILAVLTDLGLLEWVNSLPNGLDTLLGAGGRGLSAGEAQLLAFTRAFLSDPSVVILDEASSRLDLATEQLIERAVAKLLRGRTGVIIAHRLATVERADEILVLEDGAIYEHGERKALAADPESRYAALLRTGMSEVLA